MIPRTFPSIIEALQTKMVVYVLPSITGLTAWIDYIPVKGVTTESNALANTYALDGYQVVKTIESLTGQQAWLDYIPVFESASYNKPWSTDAGGYIPAGGLFSVASLFAAGEQGTWYDPSDFTTLFQDSAGTIPVTAVQQPVGLMLDKSKGLVLGPELVTNGNFSQGSTGWTVFGATISGGSANISTTGALQYIVQTIATTSKVITVTFTVTVSSGAMTVAYGSSASLPYVVNTSGTFTTILRNDGSDSLLIFRNSGACVCSIDNISVKELPGNHAFQTTSASRPVLSARYNLLTKTEQFDDAAWQKILGVSVQAQKVTAPDGTLTAQRLIFPSVTNAERFDQNITVPSGPGKFDIWMRGSGEIRLADTLSVVETKYTLTSNWVKYSLSFTWATAGASTARLIWRTSDAVITNLEVWVPDIRSTNDALGQPAYQRVNTSTDYDTVGFKPYLAFDGVDDSLVTNSIDFTATDKMTVFAGVRKLSDAATGVLVELSPSVLTNNGSFFLRAPSGAAANYYAESKGTITVGLFSVSPYSAPISNVLTLVSTISGPSAELRINGTQTALDATTQGTGNFGNYPLFIGRRNNTQAPFNGRLYSLIVRGAASTTAQITSTETYVNQKTGAY